jgi:hypothetical protein
MSQMHSTQPTMYNFFCLKIEIKTKADLYMPCKAMAHSTKSMICQGASVTTGRRGSGSATEALICCYRTNKKVFKFIQYQL